MKTNSQAMDNQCTYTTAVVKAPKPTVCAGSQLNGSHGEWTNGDDMSASAVNKHDIVVGNKRDQKTAKKNQLFSKSGNSHKAGERVANKPARNLCREFQTGACKREYCKFVHALGLVGDEEEPPPDIKVPTVITTYTCSSADISNGPSGPFLTDHSDEFVYQLPVPKLFVLAFGVGWYQLSSVQEENLKHHSPSECCSTTHLGSYVMRDINSIPITYPAKEYTLFLPLSATIRSKCRGSTVDEHFVNGVYGACSVYSATLHPSVSSHPIFSDTCSYIIDSKHYITFQRIGSTDLVGKMMSNGSKIGNGDFGPDRASIGISVRHGLNGRGQMWYTHPVTTDLPHDWEIRKDVQLEFKGQACLKRTDEADAAFGWIAQPDMQYISFGEDRTQRPLKHRTHFVQFMGFSAFSDRAFDARSMEDSIKRLVGQREGEEVYRRSALNLADWVTDKLSSVSVLHYEGSRILEGHQKLIGKRRPGSKAVYLRNLMDDQFPDREGFIWSSIVTYIELTRPGYLEMATDFTRNVFKNTVYGLWKNWNELNPWSHRGETSSLPHIKRVLRQNIHKGMPYDDEVGLAPFCRTISSMMKEELGKDGKSTRLVADMGSTCIYAISLPAFVKLATHGIREYVYRGFVLRVFIYSKPSGGDWEIIGSEIAFAMRTNGHVFVAISSDDSCYAGMIHGRSFLSNVDVSSNDSAQEVTAFTIVHAQEAHVDPCLAWGLLEGNLLPFRVTSPTDKETSVTVTFDGPMEPSGHPNTTVDNNAGSFLIAIHAFTGICCHAMLCEEAGDNMTEDIVEMAIINGAKSVGHKVTYERASCMADVQFLKRSFTWSEQRGSFIPVMNVATYLRSLGTIYNDLESVHLGMEPSVFRATPPAERMNLYCGAVVAGWRNECDNSILRALRKRFPARSSEEVVDNLKHFTVSEITDIANYSSCFDDSWIIDRYGLEANELQEIVQAIEFCELGDEFHLSGLAKIYEKDYSLKYTKVGFA